MELFSALAQDHFPNLRYLRIFSHFLVPFDRHGGAGFWQFLCNHHQLHTIILDAKDYGNSSDSLPPRLLTISPQDLVTLMPSVRYFAGPCVIFEALLKSDLARQVEKLSLIESHSNILGSCDDLLAMLGSLVSSKLPHLKTLKIDSLSTRWSVVLSALEKFAVKIPMLEALVVGCDAPREESNLLVSLSYS
jgi:hypothetical protein